MNSLNGIFLHNLTKKIVMLVAAFALWAFVMNDQNPATESSFAVPVVALNPPPEARVGQSAENVRIKLRAPRSVLAEMRTEEIKAFVDLAGLEPGTHPLHVHTVVPQGMEIVSITPETVTFTIDPIIQKRMPLRLVRVGSPPSGLTVASIEPDTRMVTIVGPQSMLKNVSEVVGTVAIPSTANGDLDIDVSLLPVDEDGEHVEDVRVVPKLISAHVSFARSLSRKVVDVKPTVEGSVASGYTLADIRVEPARIELAGASSTMDSLTSVATEPIPVVGLEESTTRTVAVILPEGVTVTNKMVTVHLVIKRQ
jgi:YbbR domain-containing protein